LPFDADYVTYVWFDALLNYVTAVDYLQTEGEDGRFQSHWPQALHLIGKDILTTHAVYWPTMLRAAGLPQPRMILAHGWWVVDGAKMSKSIGNVQRPLDLADVYGVDALRYFLMRNMTLGRDADFNLEIFQQRYQADLANNLGNLQHRVVNMIGRFCNGRIPQPTNPTRADHALQQQCVALISQTLELVENLAVNTALSAVFAVVAEINRYLERSAPWTLAKKGEMERTATVLYYAAEALRLAAVLLQPVMPEKTTELWRRLGWQPPQPLSQGLEWGLLVSGTAVTSGPPLFPREI
jgi:methionyl-tRNA synthetase